MAEHHTSQLWRVWDASGVQRLVRVESCPYGGTLWRTVAERGDRVARTGLHEVPAVREALDAGDHRLAAELLDLSGRRVALPRGKTA